MDTLARHRSGARAALDKYTDLAGTFAFNTYDRRPANTSGRLKPEDILAANLLSLRLGWRDVIPLFATGDGPPQQLLAAMDDALARLRKVEPFESYASKDELDEAMRPLATANEATRHVRGWTQVTVSKVLHRHLPHAVPIVDSRVRAFYGTRAGQEDTLRHRLWTDINDNVDWLEDARSHYTTADGQRLSMLRAADIIIWSAA